MKIKESRYAAPGHTVSMDFHARQVSGDIYATVSVTDKTGNRFTRSVSGSDWAEFGEAVATCIACQIIDLKAVRGENGEVAAQFAGGKS